MNKNLVIVGAILATLVVGGGIYYATQVPQQDTPCYKRNDLIKNINISANEVVKSPLKVTGEARGCWYFEASFPVRMMDSNGNELGVAVAQAQGDWMTENFVPFSATLSFTQPSTSNGTLVLQKDNPSGLPENEDERRIQVKFAAANPPVAKKCVISGCSGQICAEEEMVSTCEYREEYACYKSAKCERQSNGMCGWTDTPGLRACLGSSI